MREADLVERFDVPSVRRELEVADDRGWYRSEISLCEKCGHDKKLTFEDIGAVDAQLVLARADMGFETE